VKERVEQKTGAHGWMVFIGVVCLIVAIAVAIFGRVSGSTVEKIGDVTTTKAWPSETLITSLLTVGAVLVIVGFLWARITSIKVAGAEIGLSDDEKKTVSDTLTKKMPEGAKPEAAAQAALGVATALTEQKAAGASLTDDQISKVVEQHTKDLTTAG
jgi:heme/copper-type cytochrome/quinol oxidase subunit 2